MKHFILIILLVITYGTIQAQDKTTDNSDKRDMGPLNTITGGVG